ncbi:MAG: hypothetical protein IJS60_04680 [Abditibacteriota bacterium]|nr:hypothetical protein [Abditibacteriota bacterium]
MKYILTFLIIFIIGVCAMCDNMFDIPQRDKKEVKTVAHRGNSKFCPENTLTAYKSAVKLGADIVETDVHITKDGIPVFSHDGSIDRCSNGKGLIAEKTLDELKGYNFGCTTNPAFGDRYKNEPILTVEDGIKFFKEANVGYFLEIKTPAVIVPTAEIIKKLKPNKTKTMFLVWNNNDSRAIKKVLKGYNIYHLDPINDFITAEDKEAYFKELKDAGITGFSINHSVLFGGAAYNLTKEDRDVFLVLAAKYKMPVGVWTIDTTSEMNYAINYQVKGVINKKTYIGKIDLITTNDPAKCILLTGKNLK